MSNYTKTTDFEAKDSLPTGDSGKIIRGAEFETEFDAISTAIATKADTAGPTFTGTLTFETISDGTIGVTAFVDEDDMSSDSATLVPTQQSVKAYVDSQVTAQDLDFQADTGGALSIDLDSETLTFTGGTGIDTSGSGNTVTFAIDSTVATLTGTQTLTNKTLTAPTISGNLTTDGTIDGRDVATDGSKLDGIESGATADQTAAEIRTLVGSASDSNVFTDADHTKLDGIEANATADQTAAEIRTLVDSASDSNVFTDADHSKLDGIEAGATGDQTNAEIRAAVEAATDSNVFTDADHTKLDGIEASADVTDTANVTAAGALMDSELTSIASVKALNQGVATTDSPTFAAVTVNGNVEFDGLSGTGSVTVTDILDQDDMSGNSATALATQQSIKAYVDTTVAATNELVEDTTPQLGGDLDLNGNDITGTGNINITGDTTLTGSIKLPGDDKGVQFHTSLTGTEILADSSDNLTIKSLGNIVVNANDGEIKIKDGNSAFAGQIDLANDNNVTVSALISDRDLIFKGNDGGNTITALTLDMSDAGKALFNAGATFGSGIDVTGTVTADALTVTGTNANLTLGTSGNDITFNRNADNYINASGGTSSNIIINPQNRFVVNTAGAERMRIDSSGEFTLGNPSGGSALQLDVSATGTDGVDIKSAYYSGGYGPMKFHAGGSERMRIDSSGRLGIGTSSPTSLLHLSGTYPKITLNDETGVDRAFSVGTNNETFTIRNETGSADVLAITNANNVGIGTSSPAELFVLNKSSGDTFVRFDKSGTFKGLVGISDSSGSGSGSAVAGDVILRSQTRVLLDTGGTTRAVVDASGNVGIGTSSPSQALHVAGAGSMMLNESTSWSYLRLKSPSANGGYIQFADAEDDDVGQIFYYHGAGGNYMSFTTNASEAMRIDANGKVGIGVTPSGKLDVSISTNARGYFADTVGEVGSGNFALQVVNSAGSALKPFGIRAEDIRFATGSSERMRIDSSGTAIFKGGTQDNAIQIWESGSEIARIGPASGALRFLVGSTTTPRMTIDSSGNLLVGTSSANAKVYALNNGGTGLSSIRADNNSNNYTAHHFWSVLGGTGNDNTTAIHMAGYTASGNRFVIYGNGDIVNNNNSYGALSDLKLKENIINASSQWDDIKAVTIRKYSMKEDNLDAPNKLGVIAQELEAAGMGSLVYESPDRDSNGEILNTTTKQVKYSILYMKAVKALQEAMNRIEILEAEVTALKGEN